MPRPCQYLAEAPKCSNGLFRLDMLGTDAASFAYSFVSALSSCDARICFDVLGRSVQLYCQLVAMNENSWLSFEEAVDVLQGSISGFGIKEVCDRDEGKANDSPDDPEFVAQVLDTGQRSLHYGIVANPFRS